MSPPGARRAKIKADPFRFDRAMLAGVGEEARLLAGADEVGRGCLAGPLVCAAVVLDYSRPCETELKGLRDSKELTAARREELCERILAVAARVAVVSVSPFSIDQNGLHRCNLGALARALEMVGGVLAGDYQLALVDGFHLGRADLKVRRVVGGDHRSAAVAAASVVAKASRDRLMRSLHHLYPQYGFDNHVGYATSEHRQALEEHGTCPLHRLSFAGVAWRQLALELEGMGEESLDDGDSCDEGDDLHATGYRE